ncbi:MAG TPA: hypothetical protein VFD58_05125 [Blastocatellia bacterium]|nr:hypothetical protein [Blastocatellia bacterium]
MSQNTTRSGKHYPLDNLVYDLITVMQEKSQGLEAYDQYIKDAQGNDRVRQSFEKIRKQDEECITELQQHLAFLIGQQGGTSAKTASSGGSSPAGEKNK